MESPRIVRLGLFRPATVVGLAAVVLFSGAPVSAAPLFLEVSEMEVDAIGYPETSRYFTLELAEMQAFLAGAPRESFATPVEGLTLTLPLPTGTSERFSIWESSILHPELAAKYPEIKTYVGRGIDDRTATVRLDTTPAGFHALILSARRTMLIDPLHRGDARTYVSYFKRDPSSRGIPPGEVFTCEIEEDPEVVAEIDRLVAERAASPLRATGQDLLTYRIAIAATGEYTQWHGGSIADGMAGIATSLNRVTGVYEREFSIRMELIPNNDLVVYTDGATDPYTNGNGYVMLGQNQENLDTVIGNANYDIGHVFSTGGGGIAGLGVVCRSGNKARGVTGSFNPSGDGFDIDYVAHEMGHQFGGSHTFNGNAGGCSGNRSASSAYEPGSGSTIMAYAGLCGSQNLQTRSDDYFHVRSFVQITAYTQSGSGSTCAQVTPTGNDPPVVEAGNTGHTIPLETPFILYGEATDPNGDEMTYCWEQFDLGPAGHPDSPSGDAPIFRSFQPKDRAWRSFPKNSNIRNNTHTIGELLPTYRRTLHFRFTVRDNLGGVDKDGTSVEVDDTSGPFLVTSIGATPWNAGQQRTITWDVANTDAAPVSCSTVNILLSTDDGRMFLYDVPLAMGTPNDGSETVTVPNINIAEARLIVEAADNIFFDINDESFVVAAGGTGVEDLLAAAAITALEVRPNPFGRRTRITYSVARRGPVTVDVFNTAGRRVEKLFDGTRDAGVHVVEWDGRDQVGGRVASGIYFVRLESGNEVRTARVVHIE
jgi:hypothetical protein